MRVLPSDDALAVALVQAIHGGEIDGLQNLLDRHPDLASARLKDAKGATRTALHVTADWPGYFSSAPTVVRLLISAGADPNAPVTGSWHQETPLHWAASSDDVDVASALIAGGSNIEATGGSIAGGAPLDNAVGYGCWHVARLLVERGARVEKLWHAAALGMKSRVEQLLAGHPLPGPRDVNDAFFQACHGGQRRIAEYLLEKGANINWVPDYTRSTPLDAAGSLDTRRNGLVSWLREVGAKSASSAPNTT